LLGGERLATVASQRSVHAVGDGSVWALNNDEGTVSRVDPTTRN
jgi:hypothetical protein